VEEIRFLHESFGYDSFILVHDLLTTNIRFVSEFCDAMRESRLPVEWMTNSRADICLHGLLPKMKAAGCWKLFLGIESASARLQGTMNKHLEPEEVYAHVADLRDHGISATCSFVIALSDDTEAELALTLAMGARLKLLGVETVQFHRLRFFPPSPLARSGLPVQFDLDTTVGGPP
jgi:anaerobic magnesium-protoporphyrin IX monomethyl ester cyclase